MLFAFLNVDRIKIKSIEPFRTNFVLKIEIDFKIRNHLANEHNFILL